MRAGAAAARWVLGLGLVLVGLGLAAGAAQAEDAAIARDGDAGARVDQDGDVRSGDALAGSQVTAVVSAGEVSIEAHNTSRRSRARSAEAESGARTTVAVGPRAAAPEGGRSAIVQGGTNRASVDEDEDVESGSASAGSQTIVVVAEGAEVEVVQTNVSEDADARSGGVVRVGATRVVVGPRIDPPGGDARLTVVPIGPGGGSVEGPGIACGGAGDDCLETYASGTTVVLVAADGPGAVFSGWGEACASFGSSPICVLRMDTDRTVTAAFEFR